MKWKNIPRENNKNINIDSNFFDSCLSLKEKNKDILKDNNTNVNSLSNNNPINDNSVNIYSNNKNNINNDKVIFSTEKQSNFTSDTKTPEKSFDFDENIYPKYSETNNNSIVLDNDISNIKKNMINEFEIKESEEIKESKENSKIKNDMLNLRDMNNSLNLKNEDLNNDINDIIISNKLKEQDNNISKEKEIKLNINFDINKNINSIETNEICNINEVKEEINLNDINNKIEKNNDKINDENNKRIINQKELIKDNSNRSRNENILKEINNSNNDNKDNFFDSLENNNFNAATIDRDINTKTEKSKNLKNIQLNKIQILNKFLTIEKKDTYLRRKIFNTPKKKIYQISETNNICLNKNQKENIIDSSKCINKEKVDNIFIKGDSSFNNLDNKAKFNTEGKQKKNLELFVVDKNDNIFIKHNTNKNIKQNILDKFNNILENNIQERLIDSKMIINFLNNSKNEPMFPSKNFSTIEMPLYDGNEKKSFDSKNFNYKTINNTSHERKNHFYLKKAIINDNKNNINGKNNYIDNLIINEKELIEPDVQVCPVSNYNIKNNKEEMNGIYKKLNNGNILKDLLLRNRKRKNFSKINQKSKNLSFDLINNRTFDKNRTYEKIAKNKKKNHSISNDLLEFINNSKKDKENKTKTNNREIYNFKTIKYDKFNTYRLNLNKNKINKRKNKLDINRTILNKNIKTETKKNNLSFGNNNKRNVDYNRLNELYLDYKIKSIKRNQLKKEQDINSGITFIPNLNNNTIKNNQIN